MRPFESPGHRAPGPSFAVRDVEKYAIMSLGQRHSPWLAWHRWAKVLTSTVFPSHALSSCGTEKRLPSVDEKEPFALSAGSGWDGSCTLPAYFGVKVPRVPTQGTADPRRSTLSISDKAPLSFPLERNFGGWDQAVELALQRTCVLYGSWVRYLRSVTTRFSLN